MAKKKSEIECFAAQMKKGSIMYHGVIIANKKTNINKIEDKIWSLPQSLLQENGLKIFNFHPLHIYFNFHNIEQYENFKIKNGYNFSNKSNVDAFINRNNNGVQTFFKNLVSFLSDKQSYTIQELKGNLF